MVMGAAALFCTLRLAGTAWKHCRRLGSGVSSPHAVPLPRAGAYATPLRSKASAALGGKRSSSRSSKGRLLVRDDDSYDGEGSYDEEGHELQDEDEDEDEVLGDEVLGDEVLEDELEESYGRSHRKGGAHRSQHNGSSHGKSQNGRGDGRHEKAPLPGPYDQVSAVGYDEATVVSAMGDRMPFPELAPTEVMGGDTRVRGRRESAPSMSFGGRRQERRR